MVDELLERRRKLFRGPLHDPGGDIDHEAAPDDRAGLGQGPRPRRATLESFSHRALDRIGDRGTIDVLADLAVRSPQDAEEFLDMERDAVGALLIASTTSRGAGRPDSRMSVVIVAVSSAVSRSSRASSASRWASSRARHSRIGIRG